MSLSQQQLNLLGELADSLVGRTNKVLSEKIVTTFSDSDDVIPSSKLVKTKFDSIEDDIDSVRASIPVKTSDITNDGEGNGKFIIEGDSRLTNSRNPNPHNQASSTITDTATYSNIGNSAKNQASINSAIDEKIGALMNLDIIEQVTTRPTASADTMNKIYLVPESSGKAEDMFEIFVTVYENNSYKWEKLDTARIDLSEYIKFANLITDYMLLNDTNPVSGQAVYDALSHYIQKSATTGLVKNDGTIDTNNYLTQHQSLANYIQKSSTSGLIKNDGTIDTKTYLTQHQSLENYLQKSNTQGLIKNDGTVDTNQYLTEDDVSDSYNCGYVDSDLVLHLVYLETEITTTKTVIQSGEQNAITVVVTDKDGNLMEGMPVEFYIDGVKVGNTINTSSTGVASYTYTGVGAGEIEIQVKIGTFQSEIYVEDCIFYSTDEIVSNASDNYKILSSLSSLPSQFILSFDCKINTEARIGLFSSNNFSGNPNYSVFIGSPDGTRTWYCGGRTTSTDVTDVLTLPTSYHNCSIRRDGNNFYYQIDGAGDYSRNFTWFDNYSYVLGMMGWYGSQSATVKNIKLKPL